MTMIRFLSASLLVVLALSFPLTQAALDTTGRVLQPGGGATTNSPVAVGGAVTSAPAVVGGAVTSAPAAIGGATTSAPAAVGGATSAPAAVGGATTPAPSASLPPGQMPTSQNLPTSEGSTSPPASSPTSVEAPTNGGGPSYSPPTGGTSGVSNTDSGLLSLVSIASLLLAL
jgi:hypothetical protein